MPASVTSERICLAALALLVLASQVALWAGWNPVIGALACMCVFAGTVMLLDIVLLRVHLRPSTGLDWSRLRTGSTDGKRVAVKLVGLAGSLGGVALGHWLVRVYPAQDMALAGYTVLAISPVIAGLAILYVAMVDRMMTEPRDGYWMLGSLLLGRPHDVVWSGLRNHLLGWLIKGFFLPIMFVYLLRTFRRLQEHLGWLSADFILQVRWLSEYTTLLELVIVCVGYTCTLRLWDSHIRTPNPLLGAWLVTLVCYQPFNQIMFGTLLRYDTGRYWYDWFGGMPFLAVPWGIALLATFGMWLWSTAAFGIRWSNLTHRGIITSGPYRFTKHPDYISKSIFFWLVNVPFLSAGGAMEAIKTSLLMVCVNLIYFGRAKFEERHLMSDPAYAAYAQAIRERGVFRWIGRHQQVGAAALPDTALR